MSTNKTENLNLHAWTKSDPVLMEEFNENFAAIDEAIAGKLEAAMGTYTGTGDYGSSNAITLTFPFKPLLVVVAYFNNGFYGGEAWIRGVTQGRTDALMTYTDTGFVTLTWGDNSLSWYADSSAHQLNVNDSQYCYLALGVKE